MILLKTEKAHVELQPGQRTLGQRERTVLLLADGSKSLADMKGLFDGAGDEITRRLVAEGYLAARPATGKFDPSKSGAFAIGTGARIGAPPLPVGSTATAAAPVPPPTVAARTPAPQAPVAQASSSDAFEGKRSLATTRMFLFDLCERMFARRDPVRAQAFRDALRDARDRASMLAAGREMIAEIERVAGSERADSISERIAMLLPPEPA